MGRVGMDSYAAWMKKMPTFLFYSVFALSKSPVRKADTLPAALLRVCHFAPQRRNPFPRALTFTLSCHRLHEHAAGEGRTDHLRCTVHFHSQQTVNHVSLQHGHDRVQVNDPLS